jgi:hypothetical protein
VQNTQLSINFDTGRAGLWSGGLFHFTVQSRYGSEPQDTFTVGASEPHYTGLVHPGPLLANDTLPTEYFLVQSITKRFSVVLGKISDVFIPDQTLFADSYKFYFANFNLNKNPMTTNFYNPTAWAALGAWTPAEWVAIVGGVLDPNSKADNFAEDAFNRVDLYLTAIFSYKIDGMPGQFGPQLNWSNKSLLDLGSPFRPLTPSQVPAAVGALLGGPLDHLPANFKRDSGFVIANVSQYLYVKDSASEIAAKLKSGQIINGIGMWARLGYAPEGLNPITRDASIALFAHGLSDCRPYDSFGAGFYYNAISDDLKNSIALLSRGTASANDEKGMEVFYDFAITPAIRVIPSYQHIWNPLTAEVVNKQSGADVFLARFTVVW